MSGGGPALQDKAPLSWVPVRLGGKYCSPACGHGCTFVEFEKAKEKGRALAERLGPGWIPRLWENLGWHYAAVSSCGRLKVHREAYGWGYVAFLGPKDSPGGRWAERGRTPKAAVQNVVRAAKAELSLIGATLEGL